MSYKKRKNDNITLKLLILFFLAVAIFPSFAVLVFPDVNEFMLTGDISALAVPFIYSFLLLVALAVVKERFFDD